MYKIKQIPEDFIVKEIIELDYGKEGKYSYFMMKKRNYSTIRAIEHIASALHIKPKNIGFAGNKDNVAVTIQAISFFNVNERRVKKLELKDINLQFIGKGSSPISLGDLSGNHFKINVRNLDEKDIIGFNDKIKSKIQVMNYFGEQRFSNNNQLIGKAIIKKRFKKAVGLILENKGDFEEKIKRHLERNQNDYIGAINLVPFKIRKLYIHAYQSYLFNNTLDSYLELGKGGRIPIIGFGTEDENVNKILKEEGIDLRDFIVREMPDLSSEGGSRDVFFEINDLEFNVENDELNKGKKKVKLSFSLKKGCYATVAVRHLFSQDSQAPL